jgi:hypothetical protein
MMNEYGFPVVADALPRNLIVVPRAGFTMATV